MQDTDHNFMQMALDLAARGRGYTSPNPMVGAVIVKDNWVVGQGWHEAAGGPHAEINAIDDAGQNARGATLYVTLEPCNHEGKTPPCTRAIVSAGIARVVVAMADPNPHVTGGGIAYLRDAGIEVTTGIYEAEAWRLNAFFIKHTQTGRPYVILKCAATLDGQIATKTGDSKWVTGPAARTRVHELRHAVDGIMVGVDTVKSDNPSLTTRLEDKKGVDPVRIVLDTRLTIFEDAKVLAPGSESDTIVITGNPVDPDKRQRLLAKGVRVMEAPVKNDRIDLAGLMDQLGQMEICSLLVEGGSRVTAAMLTAGLVDRINFFYAPKILGGSGIAMCSGPGPEKMAAAIGVTNMEVRYFGDDLLVEGDIVSESES
ncbi:MAG: bifunctional diaminohydroxyphosphoribosylaminopyrimidine deaminase/5-amino-6-(5-phosphoribosylamino)uracil reductase RibD [Thermodesulfobacteriota bacterium]